MTLRYAHVAEKEVEAAAGKGGQGDSGPVRDFRS